ncbi:MAG: MetQ/NlpA family ABC transporter substrate-binding protein [Clostridiales bacterium]|nr:MetQ/NlpA family ABC transporter substrate-binding protein [Clostridiales bacterium]
MKKLLKLLVTAALGASVLFSSVGLAACGENDDKTIRIGASPTPHAEILKDVVKDILKEKGYTLEVVEYPDYVLPNTAVENGELDANYFQHNMYLNWFNAEYGTHLVAAAQVHYEPFGVYRGSYNGESLSDLPNGAKILVPNDGTNEARALFLLQKEGLITLKAGITPSEATKLDIAENPKNFDIVEVEAAQTALSRNDAAIAVINGNYAIQNGLKITEAIATEDGSDENVHDYVNVIAVKAGNENTDKIKALTDAVLSDAVKQYVQEHYSGAVVTL